MATHRWWQATSDRSGIRASTDGLAGIANGNNEPNPPTYSCCCYRYAVCVYTVNLLDCDDTKTKELIELGGKSQTDTLEIAGYTTGQIRTLTMNTWTTLGTTNNVRTYVYYMRSSDPDFTFACPVTNPTLPPCLFISECLAVFTHSTCTLTKTLIQFGKVYSGATITVEGITYVTPAGLSGVWVTSTASTVDVGRYFFLTSSTVAYAGSCPGSNPTYLHGTTTRTLLDQSYANGENGHYYVSFVTGDEHVECNLLDNYRARSFVDLSSYWGANYGHSCSPRNYTLRAYLNGSTSIWSQMTGTISADGAWSPPDGLNIPGGAIIFPGGFYDANAIGTECQVIGDCCYAGVHGLTACTVLGYSCAHEVPLGYLDHLVNGGFHYPGREESYFGVFATDTDYGVWVPLGQTIRVVITITQDVNL